MTGSIDVGSGAKKFMPKQAKGAAPVPAPQQPAPTTPEPFSAHWDSSGFEGAPHLRLSGSHLNADTSMFIQGLQVDGVDIAGMSFKMKAGSSLADVAHHIAALLDGHKDPSMTIELHAKVNGNSVALWATGGPRNEFDYTPGFIFYE